jgi:glycosyltransferase involved in cell wall biosynthesis
MKILMVSRWLWEERRRNGDKPGFFGELAQAITGKGIDLTILSQADDAGKVPEARPIDGLNVYVFSRERRSLLLSPVDKIVKAWGGYRKAVTDAMVIRRFVREHGPFDAVVAQCEEPDGLSCALACDGKFPPLITQVHDLRYEFDADGVRFIRKSSLGFVFRKSARVVANSEQTADWLQQEYGVPENKIGQCRIHLTAPFLEMAARGKTDVQPNGQRVLFLGALNRKKAPDIFLRAAILIVAQLPKVKFVVVGPVTSEDFTFRATLQEIASHPLLAGRIEWLGRLEPDAVIDQINEATVVVCPSRIETFSRTTIEALAQGRPVVVSETTGAAHWVKSTGCGAIVPPNDAEALAAAIRTWMTHTRPQGAAEAITSQLTARLAAEDWVREVKAAMGQRS